MRICSLLPSATEIVYALGLGDQLVGVSHTCDYPAEARSKPVVSRSIRSISHLGSREIDAIIRQARDNDNPVHWIDADLLRELRPDLIITQEICEVCAIDQASVYQTAAQALDYRPEIITTRPVGLEEIYQNIRLIGAAAQATKQADALVNRLRKRAERVAAGVADLMADTGVDNGVNTTFNAGVNPGADAGADAGKRPKVFCIDWLEPLRNTGQWTPELVELAGGVEGLAEKWGKSREITWDEVVAYQPDYLMVMPCAFDLARTEREAREHLYSHPAWESLQAVRQGQVYLFDGLIPSRHGPRTLDVLEGLAEALHPERFRGLAPPGVFIKARIG
jgi:iron complex transport system substrate-binding protein